jgi:hypothetical protein
MRMQHVGDHYDKDECIAEYVVLQPPHASE